jgi:hypothetical protein
MISLSPGKNRLKIISYEANGSIVLRNGEKSILLPKLNVSMVIAISQFDSYFAQTPAMVFWGEFFL